jgi:predicted ATPase/DNA-binding SARP family transcriptional activator
LSNELEVRLLGKFDVRCDGKLITISSRPAQSLFAYLILSAGTSHRREKLAGMLWPDSLEETARDNLRHALWRVRKALDAVSSSRFLHADDLTISFEASSDYWLDAAALQQISENASADELIAAVSIYQGELLPGFYEEWVVLEREHLYSIFEHHMARLLSLLQDEKRWLDILDWGERWIKLGQKPEPAYRALMSAHAAKGDMSKVAATYERCVKTLREFGMEPSEQTRSLYAKLKAGRETFEIGSTVLVKEKHKESPKTNLPAPLTSFIGREKEVEEIVKLLGKHRLVTLMGSGGVGKTRLAIESGNRLMSKFKNGVWWVDLTGLNDQSLVPQVVAKVVNAHEIPNQPLIDSLIEDFQSKQILLVLDNCEHLISACAQLVDRLLIACKGLRILATSREAMDILGETTWPVPSLSLPEFQESFALKALNKFESIRLFMDRAGLVEPRFELTNQNAGSVVQICHRLSGIPLAIELAAALAKMMSVDEIAQRLDDRFDLLTSGNRTALPRHQTLRATIDWSYDLLSEPERILFRRLSVFAGGFTLAAAEAVAAGGDLSKSQVINLLGQLINKSLVTVGARSEDLESETRYGVLETIREYARKKLEEANETEAVRERHLEFFAIFATQAEKGIYSSKQAAWFRRLDKEADNLRAAMDWPTLIVQNKDSKLRSILKSQFMIVGLLGMFWEIGYRREITEALKRMLELDRANEPSKERARALTTGGFLLWSLNNPSDARAYLEESAKIARKLGDRLILAWSMCYLGWTFDSLGEYDEAKTFLEGSLALAMSLGEDGKYVAGHAMTFLGDIPYWQGNILEARKLYEKGIAFVRELNNMNLLTSPLRRLAYIEVREGNFVQAAHLFGESLELNRQLGHLQGMVACLAGFAAINLVKGNLEQAATLCGCVENLLQRFGGPFFFADTVEYERSVSQLKKALDERALLASWSKGRAMTMEQALEYALKET